ncbi:MAG: asparagine synthetase B family protein, partial [Longimicrobiales bacterium]
MRHRGPDDAGLWCSTDARVVLAHRRLSIIDLSAAGCQPFADATGNSTLVLNGEVYNYRELRAELQALGHSFRTATDTEVLLAAYAQWGQRCLERLVGMFAFAIYDQRSRSLFAARDPAGEKPFYYWHSRGTFWFGSE